MTATQISHQRIDRILKAVALEPGDRTPVVLEYAGFAAHVTVPGRIFGEAPPQSPTLFEIAFPGKSANF